MTHIKEHCNTPRFWRRREGDVWACECGQLWRVSKIYYVNFGYMKTWEPIEMRKK